MDRLRSVLISPWVSRIASFLFTCLIASIIIFLILRLLPGDVADLIAGDVISAPEFKEAVRSELGLDQPLYVQYGNWLLSIISGNFGGSSLISGQPIGELLARQIPVTILLATGVVLLSLVTGLPLGIAAAMKKDRWPDTVIRLMVVPGQSLPGFWLAIICLLMLAAVFKWSPPLVYSFPWQDPWNHFQMIIIPLLLLTWEYGSHIVRVTRSGIAAAMQEDQIRALRAKGLTERQIIIHHALRAAAPSLIATMALQFGVLLGGVMILESIFGLPGVGRGLIGAALQRDLPVIQTYVLLIVAVVLLVNLAADRLHRAADPRLPSGAGL
ncbi:ABC transporter permease [Dehalogenimonas alkenigignens]|uniref:ABC-type dipeptide/oligopeptide/nickel transport system, permease component n=1 Tax=Dehalogenimonas alkenigignens TaxID=1217799 RepID=A0A0W0GJU6_9CHLR|nr:ABC transporter permease [Dehalogenimonas alkenigignens]KTB48837.1 ABC-type dipeptide/oligopeptide/nickel transport system, permease component [Dehalogenimonas alkenigignens]